MDYQEFTYSTLQGLPLMATFYPATHSKDSQTILYIHGGGLVWGSRKDLPADYIDLFHKAGYNFLTFDYPLAPETTLPEIVASIKQGIQWFHKVAASELKLSFSDFHLFGRSAGAYLAFLVCKDQTLPQPKTLISFYGYESINASFYSKPSPYYLHFPTVSVELKNAIIGNKPLAFGAIEERYGIYMYARQSGRWLDMVLPAILQAKNYSLTDTDLLSLPPTFLAQSTTDEDVPYEIGESLAKKIPINQFVSVENEPHDFDKNPKNSKALAVYHQLIQWLTSHEIKKDSN
ncbi:hypothetical protein CKN86_10040 [Carnobacterium divergens]|uniref:alpha/beta hydrolase n=1 Tax=Carnobacterium divergens TaxID=2748 RepID=UPI000D422D06|nr:alpha/beta hydrolase [Carnobacterium divergens]MCO6017829.1 alpha/beta hydrolase [Carnobacterium divergens]TFI60759.1 hypothetical protein CKN62_10180 [Carnobacterium divergens]TFI87782.1 hypothetical protein CKN84_10070 [Carnobacterium divergens]TFJ02350.1 hypothetical protein CKN86_10040 [Carnobacterium divergens]TFJ03860.1 hypothetical protein CKN65_10080 [Carnobacterium divergens]